MLTPIKVQTKQNCVNRMNNLLHADSSNGYDSELMELTKTGFTDSVDYRKVYKNFDYTKSYDAWIYEGNDKDKIVGYKYLQSYPYDLPQFKIGDYIHWNFNHLELSTWILISLDVQYLYNVKGRMLQCNNSLRWKDKKTGETNCYPCVIEDAITYTNFKWGNRGVVQNSGDIVVVVQKNEDTSKIEVNDRFLFNETGFRVKQLFNELNPNYMELYMMKINELENDDLENNIAINEKPDIQPDKMGNVILPSVDEILLDETKEFLVYNYVQGRKNQDTFSIKIENVPAKYYSLEIISGNNFSIKNLSQYKKNPMNVVCTNDTTGEEVNMKIWLGGNW